MRSRFESLEGLSMFQMQLSNKFTVESSSARGKAGEHECPRGNTLGYNISKDNTIIRHGLMILAFLSIK